MAAKVDNSKCTGCGVCKEVCAVDAIKIENEKAVINDECVECGICVNECPNEAISLPT
ncbi:MAG: 4Fe-4S binding protein [Candidatus Omnitrophica bacterium]|nr:4Fe-4S binding protein [Candidatus Omnitrophota bacterium]